MGLSRRRLEINAARRHGGSIMKVRKSAALVVLVGIGLMAAYHGVCSWEDGESNIL